MKYKHKWSEWVMDWTPFKHGMLQLGKQIRVWERHCTNEWTTPCGNVAWCNEREKRYTNPNRRRAKDGQK